MAGGGEAAHGEADLGEHILGAAPLHAGDAREQLNRRGKGGELPDRLREQFDLVVEELEHLGRLIKDDVAVTADVDKIETTLANAEVMPGAWSTLRGGREVELADVDLAGRRRRYLRIPT